MRAEGAYLLGLAALVRDRLALVALLQPAGVPLVLARVFHTSVRLIAAFFTAQGRYTCATMPEVGNRVGMTALTAELNVNLFIMAVS